MSGDSDVLALFEHGPTLGQHRACVGAGVPSRVGEGRARSASGRGNGQEVAAFTSWTTFFSTTALHFLTAYDTGHRSPSSRFATSWKPRVEYR